ncbi:hypothetical protein EJP77_04760 [Paenibacillus zeisoli]|uniref:Uncharacterized protein n=1 Tax=Paenibacillus zeisoli TaxID=2496267 RepID=A0A3S1BB65_9BACL|nr:hypothetical protein [Paenibacillus zeisoli]RUT36304.1 hypothetical protein EJP77_04760 [Paenibacillus zeisoli]
MTIIITCAVIALLIIAVLVSINVRSGSASSRERAKAVNEAEQLEQPAAAESELAAAQFTEGTAAPIQVNEAGSAVESAVPEAEANRVHVTEPQANHTADQEFREALRRLKEQPAQAASPVPEHSNKMADDAYRRALRSFKEQPKEK